MSSGAVCHAPHLSLTQTSWYSPYMFLYYISPENIESYAWHHPQMSLPFRCSSSWLLSPHPSPYFTPFTWCSGKKCGLYEYLPPSFINHCSESLNYLYGFLLYLLHVSPNKDFKTVARVKQNGHWHFIGSLKKYFTNEADSVERSR